MSVHLGHKLPWKNFLDLLQVRKDSGIELPTGKCGRIHVTSRRIELKLKNREYLADKVCTDPECEVKDTNRFYKERKTTGYALTTKDGDRKSFTEVNRHAEHFAGCFIESIVEFAETERKKVGIRSINNNINVNEIQQQTIEKLKLIGKWDEKDWKNDSYYDHCLCRLFTILIEAGDTETLLSFSDEQIKKVLSCQHGGLGNNISFLEYYVLDVYLSTNLILLCGLHDKPETWASMKPNTYFRQSLMYDCDGQTFLTFSRKFLSEEVYMKDFNAMKQLLKDSFQFLYFVEMLRREINFSCRSLIDKEDMLRRICNILR